MTDIERKEMISRVRRATKSAIQQRNQAAAMERNAVDFALMSLDAGITWDELAASMKIPKDVAITEHLLMAQHGMPEMVL